MSARVVVVRMPRILTARGNREAFRVAARRALLQIGRETQTEIRKRIAETRDSRGFRGRQDTGKLTNSITAQAPVVSAHRATQATVSQPPAGDYAPVIEEGRRPGARMPPVAPIRRWLERTTTGKRIIEAMAVKLKAEGEKITKAKLLDRAALQVARSIGRKGTPGIHMFAGAHKVFSRGRARTVFARHLAAAARART